MEGVRAGERGGLELMRGGEGLYLARVLERVRGVYLVR